MPPSRHDHPRALMGRDDRRGPGLRPPALRRCRLTRCVRVGSMSDWDIEIGETLPRRELHARHGGAWYGGMEPAVASNSVFLFTNPSQGEAFGYKYDGWQPDGTFHYTGDGQVGTQNPAQGGNAALLAAASKGRTVRLFRSEGTLTTYLGAFELLDDPPYFTAPAPDREGNLRDVLVFRLSPVGDVLRDQSDVAPPPPFDVLALPLEALDVDNYERQRPQEPREAVRREAALVADTQSGCWPTAVTAAGSRFVSLTAPACTRTCSTFPRTNSSRRS